MLDTYITSFPTIASYILKSSRSFLSAFATNISYPFHITFKQQFTSTFFRHILSRVFD